MTFSGPRYVPDEESADLDPGLVVHYADIDCPRCGHEARHVIGRTTGIVYCLACGGACRDVAYVSPDVPSRPSASGVSQ